MLAQLSRLRVGFGYDIHRFADGVPLVLGGVHIDHPRGLQSHTDGDAVCHAVTDALLSACGLPDIGTVFPPEEDALRGAESDLLLQQTVQGLYNSTLEAILNLNVTVLCEAPKLAPHRSSIIRQLADCLGTEQSRINVSAGTNERFDAVGRGEALVAFAHILVLLKEGAEKPAARARQSELQEYAVVAEPDGVAGPDGGHVSPRAQAFERAVQTKLVPLPLAPAPRPGDELILYTDGASRGNPGPAAGGWVLLNAEGLLVHEQGKTLGNLTNNEAEYAAVRDALEWIELSLGTQFRLTLRMDSELAVKQLRGEYKIKADNLRQGALLAMSQLANFRELRIEHVPRAENSRADALCNQALGPPRPA